MKRRVGIAAVAAALTLVAPTVQVVRAQETGPTTFYLHWDTGCSGTSGVDESGTIDLTNRPSEDDCVLFFPGITPSEYVFHGEDEGVPFRLDATKPVGVRFVLSTIAHAAVQFDFSVSGRIGGTTKQIAAGTHTILAATVGQPTVVEVNLPADPSLDGSEVSRLSFSIAQTEGVSYSTMNLTTDSGWVQVAERPTPNPTPTPTP